MGFSRQECWSGVPLPSPKKRIYDVKIRLDFKVLLGTELLHVIYGEGDGTPLQYSCLENPMGGGAWWAAVHGVGHD